MSTEASPQFAQVSRQLAAPLLRYLTRQVGDVAIAEDLCQETMIKIERGLAGFAERADLKTWAFAIANHVVIDYLRQGAQRLKLVDIDEAASTADGEVAVDERLVIDEMNTCVRSVIDSLPAAYRAALILYDLEGMSIEQTAAVTACSSANAKIRIHRARQRLKAALARECDFYRDSASVLRCTRS